MTEVPEHADKTGGGETPQDMNQHPTLTETASPLQVPRNRRPPGTARISTPRLTSAKLRGGLPAGRMLTVLSMLRLVSMIWEPHSCAS